MHTRVTEVLEIMPSPLGKDFYSVISVHTRAFFSFARTCKDLGLQDRQSFSFLSPSGTHLGVLGLLPLVTNPKEETS